MYNVLLIKHLVGTHEYAQTSQALKKNKTSGIPFKINVLIVEHCND